MRARPQDNWLALYETEERRQETQTMGRYASDTGGGDFKQAPAGSHIGRAIKITDLGTQHGEYQGDATVRNQVLISWELPNETIEIEGTAKPLIVSKFYTNSLSEKANLRRDLESWRARPFTPEELERFDLMKILGATAILSVVHNEKGKARVVGVSALPKGMTCPPAFNKPSAFWIDEWDDNAFAGLSEGIQKIIMQSDEYKAAFTPPSEQRAVGKTAGKQQIDDEEIPF